MNFRFAKKLLSLFIIIDINDIRKNKRWRNMDKTAWVQGSLNIEFVSDNLKQIQSFKLPTLKIFVIQIKICFYTYFSNILPSCLYPNFFVLAANGGGGRK